MASFKDLVSRRFRPAVGLQLKLNDENEKAAVISHHTTMVHVLHHVHVPLISQLNLC